MHNVPYKTKEEKEMIDSKPKRTEIPTKAADEDIMESEHSKMWDNPSMLILLMDAMGLEIIKDTEYLPLAGPIYVKCEIEIAQKLRKSFHFDVGLCGDNVFRISLDRMDHPLGDDPSMIALMIANRKEFPTRKAEHWLDMVIEDSYVGSEDRRK
jgi:hypothetical protein